MISVTGKVCVVGDFAVGKTSLIERFVSNQFSDKYLTTVGVKIDTKEIALLEQGIVIKLIVWDVAGADEFGPKEFAYLRGASGVLFVVDGTRAQTLESARGLHKQLVDLYGERPSILLLNKNDLAGMWQLSDEQIQSVDGDFDSICRTSAKTGDAVDTAFKKLAELIVGRDLQERK